MDLCGRSTWMINKRDRAANDNQRSDDYDNSLPFGLVLNIKYMLTTVMSVESGERYAQAGWIVSGGGASIRAVNGNIMMNSGSGGDAAIRVTCTAGSSIFFVSAGGTGNFTKPSVCGGGIETANSVKSRVTIENVNED
ncbi:hypothetical protein LZ32DRAFT_621661 [Colletotrichum eremochloae]|nr:hypothetical protein LZ32DRAFT_621661 [Colletotrichum eremochloae]